MNTNAYPFIMLSLLPQPLQREAAERMREGSFPSAGFTPVKTPPHLASVYGISPERTAEIIISRCDKSGIIITAFGDETYPELLREIPDPPMVLYSDKAIPCGPFVSIVGTRSSDSASERAASSIASLLAQNGLCVASGLASGIDRFAHLGALDAAGASTGILPNGIDMVYPASNKDIYKRMKESGICALISEYPPGVFGGKWTFVRRNRIIAGLSKSTLVIKAGMKSGAMITAKYALEQGRELFAGGSLPFDDAYAGCRSLLSDGASIIDSADAILAVYGIKALIRPPSAGKEIKRVIPRYPQGSIEEKIISALIRGPQDIDTIIRGSGISSAAFQHSTLILELAGCVRRSGSTLYLLGTIDETEIRACLPSLFPDDHLND